MRWLFGDIVLLEMEMPCDDTTRNKTSPESDAHARESLRHRYGKFMFPKRHWFMTSYVLLRPCPMSLLRGLYECAVFFRGSSWIRGLLSVTDVMLHR
jgi:hypothetical protein